MAHLVPQVLRVPIRGVLHDLKTVGREVGEHRGATDVEEGTDDPASPDRDSGQPAGPRPLNDPHENGLGLVLGGVAERDALGPGRPGDLLQGRMASEARRFLRGPAPEARDLDSDDVDRAVQTGRQGLDEGGIPVSLRSETMVNVTNAESERELGTEEDEGVQEGDGVRPPRDAYEDMLSRVDKPLAGYCRPHRGGQERGLRLMATSLMAHRRHSNPAGVTHPGARPRRTRPRTARASRWGRSA